MIGLRMDVSGSEMAAVASRDSQFQIPRQPMLLPGLVFIPFEHGLIVDGTVERQVFRGRGVRDLLPQLFPLLDGRNTVGEIGARLPDIPAPAIANAIALLYSRGLLEEGAEAHDPDWCGAYKHVAQFFHRHIDVTRVHVGAGTALRELGAYRVLIVGEVDVCRFVSEQLALCGMQHVTIRERVDSRDCEKADLVVIPQVATQAKQQLRMVDDMCSAVKIPWLRTALLGTTIEIGPWFRRGEGACYQCFERLYETSSHSASVPKHRLETWASLVATEIVMLASRLGELASGHSMLTFNMDDWTLIHFRPPSAPDCEVCGSSTCRPHTGAALAYEQAVTSPSKRFLNPKAQQVHHRAVQRALQQVRPRYLSYPAQVLPEETSDRSKPRADLSLLARIVRRGAGFERVPSEAGERPRRWAPSAGNLGSVQIYLIAASVIDLLTGAYYYDAPRDVLALVRPQAAALRLAHLCEATAPDGMRARAACWVVLTAALGRLRAKYGPLGYRLAHLDAGVALAQMEAVAREAGVSWATSQRWHDEAISRELKLDEHVEPLTAVAAICV